LSDPPGGATLHATSTSRPLTTLAVILSMAMAAMESTVVGTAMPTIISDLGGLALYGWVGSAYLLASTVAVPVFGKLADLFGRKRILLGGVALFLLGSLASGAATSIVQLIAARALQGLGAGAMQPVGLTIVGDIYTLEERGRVQGFFGAVWGIAGISGPLLGGLIVHVWSWRWVFWINVPFGLASMAVLAFAYREAPPRDVRVRIDWAGAFTLTVATLALLLGAGRQWPSITLPVAAVAVALFLFAERRAAEPVLPLDLLARRVVATSALSNALTGAVMMGCVIYIPLFVQGALRLGPAQAGGAIAPMLVGWPIAATLTGRRLTRIGFRAPIRVGAALCLVGIGLFAVVLGTHATARGIQASMFVFGCGMGVANTALVVALQTSVEQRQRGVVTALGMFARSIGGAIGVGGLGVLLAARIGSSISPDMLTALLTPHRARGAAPLASGAAEALRVAMLPLFQLLLALVVLNAIVVAFYPRDRPT